MKVIYVNSDGIRFEDNTELFSEHDQDCCESHYLSFDNLSLADFEGLDFDIESNDFFERVEDFGIRLVPTNGHPLSVPGYGYNNGYYSTNLTLVLQNIQKKFKKEFAISECQVIND